MERMQELCRRELACAAYEMAGARDFDRVSAERLLDADTQQAATYLAEVDGRLAGDSAPGVSSAHERTHDVAQATNNKGRSHPWRQ